MLRKCILPRKMSTAPTVICFDMFEDMACTLCTVVIHVEVGVCSSQLVLHQKKKEVYHSVIITFCLFQTDTGTCSACLMFAFVL